MIEISVNGTNVMVHEGTTLAAALLHHGVNGFRNSVSGESRQPLCGIGACFECRVTVDGELHQRSCLIPVRNGMNVVTGG